MKITLALLGLLSLAAAQFGKGKGGAGKGGKGLGGKGMGGIGKSGGSSGTMACLSKCAQDNLGIDASAVMSGGAPPANFPCSEAAPKLTDLSSGKMPDIAPVLTCICRQPKFKSAMNCVTRCPGGAIVGKFSGQFDKTCQNPKAFADQLNSLVSKFGGMMAGKGGAGGMGGIGSMGSMGGAKGAKGGKFGKGAKGGKGGKLGKGSM